MLSLVMRKVRGDLDVFLAKIRIFKTISELKITSMYHKHTFVVSKCMMWYTVVVSGLVVVLGACKLLIQAYSLDFMFITKCSWRNVLSFFCSKEIFLCISPPPNCYLPIYWSKTPSQATNVGERELPHTSISLIHPTLKHWNNLWSWGCCF